MTLYQSQVGEAESYLSSRGIDAETTDRFRLGWVGWDNSMRAGRLAIPYLTPAGPWQIKFRCIQPHDCGDHGHPKYYYETGETLHLFNAATLNDAADICVICEGELDAITAEQAGVPAVSYPGVNAWRANPHWRWCFDSVDLIVVVADWDKPKEGERFGVGKQAADAIAKSLKQSVDGDVKVIALPEPHDSNSYIIEFGELDYLYLIGAI